MDGQCCPCVQYQLPSRQVGAAAQRMAAERRRTDRPVCIACAQYCNVKLSDRANIKNTETEIGWKRDRTSGYMEAAQNACH